MGTADRKMQRALEVLDQTYGAEIARQRIALGDARRILEESSADDPLRTPLLTDMLAAHLERVRMARAAADRVGGGAWLARSGHDEVWVAEHLWTEHAEPLTGLRWAELRDHHIEPPA